MARRLVYFCIGVLTWTVIWAQVMVTLAAIYGWEVNLSDVLTMVGAAFGGELLMLLLKRVFAKDKTTGEEYEE